MAVPNTIKYAPIFERDDVILEGKLKLINQINLEADVLCLRFNDSGKFLAVGLTDGTVMIYCVESEGFTYVLSHGSHANIPVTSLKWKPDGANQLYDYILIATYVSGELRTWHVTTSSCLHVCKEDCQLLVTAYNCSGNRSIAGGDDGRIYMYDEVIGAKISTMGPGTDKEVMDGHVMRVFALQFHPLDENVFVSGGWDKTIQWWDTRVSTQYSIKKIFGPHLCGEGIDIESNTDKLVTASWRKVNNLEVYDFGTGKMIKEIPAYTKSSMLYCAQWKDRHSLIVGGSNNHTLSITDYKSTLKTGSALNLPGGVCALDISRNSVYPIIAAASSKHVFFFSDDE